MRISNIILLIGFIIGIGFISCERKDDVEPADVQPQKTGRLTVEVYRCNPQNNPGCQGNLQPLSGARVIIVPATPGAQQDSSLSTLTLANGEATFLNLHPGTYHINTEYIDEEQVGVETIYANTEKFHRVVFLEE